MEHEYHKNRVVLHAFDTTSCKECSKVISTRHIPGNKVCEECSKKLTLCEVCGEPMYRSQKVTLDDGSWYYVEEDRKMKEFYKSLGG